LSVYRHRSWTVLGLFIIRGLRRVCCLVWFIDERWTWRHFLCYATDASLRSVSDAIRSRGTGRLCLDVWRRRRSWGAWHGVTPGERLPLLPAAVSRWRDGRCWQLTRSPAAITSWTDAFLLNVCSTTDLWLVWLGRAGSWRHILSPPLQTNAFATACRAALAFFDL